MMWFAETFQTSHGSFWAVLVPLPMWLALGVVGGVFEHDWDRAKVPQVVLFGAVAGLLAVMPSGQVVAGVLAAATLGGFSWGFAETGLQRRARVEAGR